jgi:isobutyryl-CoA mutase small subunit
VTGTRTPGVANSRSPYYLATSEKTRLRIVIGKPGLDGHDRGVKIVARALRDAGHEVVYTGLHQTPEQIVETAIQEDADLIGLSVLSGAHMTLFKAVLDLLVLRQSQDIPVFGGGIVPDSDLPLLERMGVRKVFTPGAPTSDITAWVRDAFAQSSGAQIEVGTP